MTTRLKPDASGLLILCDQGCGGGCGGCPTLQKKSDGTFILTDDHDGAVTLTKEHLELLQNADLSAFSVAKT